MKICAACNEELPRESFSKKQWQMRQYRRCKGCIDAGRAMQLQARPALEEPTPPPLPLAAAEDKVAASCWLCLDEGADELGQPLRRDCSCRGDTASFAHLSCLVEYAKHNTLDQLSYQSWTVCPQCLQRYENELAVELATELVSFAEKQYQGNQFHAGTTALEVKLHVLARQQAHHGEAKRIANKILSTIESKKAADYLLPQYVREVEARVYTALGALLYNESTKEGARVAIENFEKAKCMGKELGWDTTCVDSGIAAAKLRQGDSKENKEDLIKWYQQGYEHSVAKHGEEHSETVNIGLRLAHELREGNRTMEAEELCSKLLVTCKLLHGPDHEKTKAVEALLRECARANQNQAQL